MDPLDKIWGELNYQRLLLTKIVASLLYADNPDEASAAGLKAGPDGDPVARHDTAEPRSHPATDGKGPCRHFQQHRAHVDPAPVVLDLF